MYYVEWGFFRRLASIDLDGGLVVKLQCFWLIRFPLQTPRHHNRQTLKMSSANAIISFMIKYNLDLSYRSRDPAFPSILQ